MNQKKCYANVSDFGCLDVLACIGKKALQNEDVVNKISRIGAG